LQDRQDDALPLFQDALQGLAGRDGTRAVKKNLGQTLFELRRYEEASEILEEVIADQEALRVPDEGFMAEVLRVLAMVYRASGNDVRAEDAYARLAELDQPWVS